MNEHMNWTAASINTIKWVACPTSTDDGDDELVFRITEWLNSDYTAEKVADGLSKEPMPSIGMDGEWYVCSFTVYRLDQPICRVEPISAGFLAGVKGTIYHPDTCALFNCGCFECCEHCDSEPKVKPVQPGYYQWTASSEGLE